MSTVGKRSHGKLIHREQAQSGTPTDCLNFPRRFLLDVVSAEFDDALSLLLLCCRVREDPKQPKHTRAHAEEDLF